MSLTFIYGQITYNKAYEGTKRCVQEISPYVDHVIIICEKQRPFTSEQKQELLKHGNVILLEKPFNDNIPEFRNHYLNKAKELARGKTWLCVSDSDEYYCEELRKNLRKIIAEYDAKGYNQLGIRCRERFLVHEWMDEIDKLKELPIGFRESNYYKLLIFKICCDKLHYEGIGTSKTVHETWFCPIHQWKPIYLPPHLTYEHIKNTWQTWRNSARNVFCGGGGNNLGDLIPEWTQLKAICTSLGIKNWAEYEANLKRGNINPLLKNFLIKSLEMPRTDYGVEYRQMALWYFSMHKNELTPEILHKIKNPPKLTHEQETEYYVIRCYREVLGREPDDQGRQHYTKAILEGKIKREELIPILMASEEYKRKFNIPEIEHYVTKCYVEVLRRQPDRWGLRTYVEHIKAGRIKKEELPQILRESEEYTRKFGDKS